MGTIMSSLIRRGALALAFALAVITPAQAAQGNWAPAGASEAADITDAGAVGIDLLQSITDTDAFNAMSFGSHAAAFLQADGNVLARTALGAQTQDDFLDDILNANGVCLTGEFLKFDGANLVCDAVPGGGDALTTNPLSQFAATTSAQVAGVISDETGSGGGFVRATSPTIATPTFSGLVTFSGTDNWTAAAMAALEIDTTKRLNSKSISADTIFTYSATPSSGTWFGLFLTNTDTAPHLITLPSSPSSYSMAANATKNTFVVPPSSNTYIQWRYNGTLLRMFGEPTARDNYAATAAPAVTNDVDEGYAVGSKWTDTTLDIAYECLDATDGAAVWRRVSNIETIVIAISDETTAHTTGLAKVTFRMPFAMTLTSVRGSLTTASSSGIPTWDINESGTTVISTKLTIDANEKTSTTAAVAAVISDSALADDAEITIDIDTSGTGAAGGKVTLIGYRP